jgi:hypothetical protein
MTLPFLAWHEDFLKISSGVCNHILMHSVSFESLLQDIVADFQKWIVKVASQGSL